MLYAISHLTEYEYSAEISENVMEVRKHPISTEAQRCLNFTLSLDPEVRVFRYHDHLGNLVHHFDIPWSHRRLSILGESVVEVKSDAGTAICPLSWEQLRERMGQNDLYDMLQGSQLVQLEESIARLQTEWGLRESGFETPQQLVWSVVERLPGLLRYQRDSTRVDTPSSAVLQNGTGVCQDFAHVALALLRRMRIPCRYISGYRFEGNRSTQDTSYAWIEAYVDEKGWSGFDPSRGTRIDEGYVTTCIGRDYSDCPPTRGVYRGVAQSQLRYAVQIRPAEQARAPGEPFNLQKQSSTS